MTSPNVEEFYNRCHGANGRFCSSGVRGAGSFKKPAGARWSPSSASKPGDAVTMPWTGSKPPSMSTLPSKGTSGRRGPDTLYTSVGHTSTGKGAATRAGQTTSYGLKRLSNQQSNALSVYMAYASHNKVSKSSKMPQAVKDVHKKWIELQNAQHRAWTGLHGARTKSERSAAEEAYQKALKVSGDFAAEHNMRGGVRAGTSWQAIAKRYGIPMKR